MKGRQMIATRTILMVVMVTVLSGCATTKMVTITSEPTGAVLYLNGVESGITPFKKELSFDKTKEIIAVAKKEGFKDGSVQISYEPGEQKEYHIALEKTEAVSIELVSFEPQPTPQGVKLAVIRKPTLAYLEVIERSPNVAAVTRVTNNEDRGIQIGPPVLSFTNVLAYWEYIEEQKGSWYSNIYKMTVGSFAKTRLTYGKWRDLFPAFTPNGQYLVFSSNRTSPNSTLWRIKVEGAGGITKITNTQAEDFSPSVSPDGKLIAYGSNPPGAEESQIWIIPMDGSLTTQLREGQGPQFSPGGKKILFVRRDKLTKRYQLWLMVVDGTEETQLTQNTDYDVIDAKWSLDGKYIVYASDEGRDSRNQQNFDIWMMNVDGSGKTQLTTNGSRDDSPSWDHTGEHIYFRSNRGGAWNIWRFRPLLDRR